MSAAKTGGRASPKMGPATRLHTHDGSPTSLLRSLTSDPDTSPVPKGYGVAEELRLSGWHVEELEDIEETRLGRFLEDLNTTISLIILELEAPKIGARLYGYRRCEGSRSFTMVGPGTPPLNAHVLAAWMVRRH